MTRLSLPELVRRRAPRGEQGSMAFYLVIAMVGMGLGALMVPMITTSSLVTRADTSRGHAIDAARAGLNVMLGKIRASTTDSVGSSTKLPCDAVSGTVSGAGNPTYTVSVAYYMNDPVKTAGATAMRCVNGYGTYDPTSGSFTPRYARITSVGKEGTSVSSANNGRTLTSTYTFKTTNTNIVGGLIRIYPASGATTQYCMDAGSVTPAVGTVVKLQACSQPPSEQQIFGYRSDLTIQLLSSVTSTNTLGLCVDTADPPTKGNTVVLNTCAALGSPTYTQQWSFNDSGGFTASLNNSKTTGTLSTQCMAVASPNAGIAVTLDACSNGGVSSPTQAWIPTPAVGAGAAAAPQLINYEEFGRCLDITGQNVNADHLIDYPCKQNPKPDAVAFNQKFTTPAIASGSTTGTGQIYTVYNNAKYCLTTPGTSGGYVTTTQCVDGQSNQQWTVYNGDSSLAYSAKYQILDNGGRCLALTNAKTGEQWSAIDVEACTGAVEQKWNASPDLVSSSVSGITEPTTGGS